MFNNIDIRPNNNFRQTERDSAALCAQFDVLHVEIEVVVRVRDYFVRRVLLTNAMTKTAMRKRHLIVILEYTIC